MSKTKFPTPEHLAWMIEGRAKNQTASLELYKLIKDREDLPELQLAGPVQELVGVSFSLWRAVFLADRTEDETRTEHAVTFLAKMLTDNAIAFTQDRENREWTFNYYLDSARFRLDQLGEEWTKPSVPAAPVIAPAKRKFLPVRRRKLLLTRRMRWNALHEKFETAVGHLAARLKSAKISK